MDQLLKAATLRHYGLELIQLAAEIEAEHRQTHLGLPRYTPTFPVDENGIEQFTGRLACCGAGPDQRRDGQRQHLDGCSLVAADGLAAARKALAS